MVSATWDERPSFLKEKGGGGEEARKIKQRQHHGVQDEEFYLRSHLELQTPCFPLAATQKLVVILTQRVEILI